MRSGKLYICLFVLMVAFMVKATAAWAQTSDIMNMHVTGAGITGDGIDPVTSEPDESIPLINYAHDMSVSYRPETGEVIGALRFSAVKIQTAVESSTVPITQTLVSGAILETITIKTYRNTGSGYKLYYQIDYTNARFVSISTGTPEPANNATSPKIAMKFITFVYSNVKWTYTTTDGGNLTTSVDWGPPQ